MKLSIVKSIAVTIVFMTILPGCASYLNSRYQKVSIVTPANSKVEIRGSVKQKKGNYYLKRDGKTKEITVLKDGYKSETKSVIAYKTSGLKYVSWSIVPVVAVIQPGAAWITASIGLFDGGPKSKNYDKSIVFNQLKKLPSNNETKKNIKINKVSLEVSNEDFNYIYYKNFKYFKKDNNTSKTYDESIQLENTIFTESLNEILTKRGYVDESNKVLKKGYLKTLLVNATINKVSINRIDNPRYFSDTWSRTGDHGFITIELDMKWDVLDYYDKVIHEVKIKGVSGQYALKNVEVDNVYKNAVNDAVESSFIEFMANDEVIALLNDDSVIEKEASYEDIIITNQGQYVSSISQAIKSSVTVTNSTGHGSGFVIGSDGYVLTNYHVISDTTDLKVIMNDGSEYTPKIIRTSMLGDLALLKIDAENLIPFTLYSSDEIEIATEIYAVGTPFGEDLAQTISRGIVSGLRKKADGSTVIQTDASINGGNSGGAMITKEGVVYGVVSAKLSGFGVEGVAFGIPAYQVIDKLKIKIK